MFLNVLTIVMLFLLVYILKILQPLVHVQRAAAHVIIKTSMLAHISNHLRELHWLPIHYGIDFKILLVTYCCLQGDDIYVNS